MRKRPLFYLALAAGCSIYLGHSIGIFKPAEGSIVSWVPSAPGPEIFLGGVIESEVETRQVFDQTHQVFDLDCKKIWADGLNREVRGRVRVVWKAGGDFRYGDEIVLGGRLELPRGRRNPGGFDQKRYLEIRGIRALLLGDRDARSKILRRDRGRADTAFFLKIRRQLCSRIRRDFTGEDGAFLEALFFGEKKDLEEDTVSLFLSTGTLHLLAVSGFNIGFLTATLFFFLRPLPVSRRWKVLTAMAAVWVYCLIVGWQAPIVRASIVATVFLCGRLSGRRTDLFNSTGLAALIILAINPLEWFSLGFQLSFAAILAIGAFTRCFIEKPEWVAGRAPSTREKTTYYFKELFWVSFVASVATLPITVQNFFIVSPAALLANLVVVPLSFLIFFAGVVYFLTVGWLSPFLAVLVPFERTVFQGLVTSLEVIESIPGAVVTVGRLEPPLWAALTIGIVYFFWDPRLRRPLVRAAVLMLFCADIFLLQAAFRQADERLEVVFLDVGQGDSIYLRFPDGRHALVDAGPGGLADAGRRIVAPFLRSQGVSDLELVVISHPQEDHLGGLETILRDFGVQTYFDPGKPHGSDLYARVRSALKGRGVKVFSPAAGDRLSGLRKVKIEFLNPRRGEEPSKNINDDSLVLRVRHGSNTILLTGDIQEAAIKKIVACEADLHAEVLKVPHHGARLGESGPIFIKAIQPCFSVISAGAHNPFGHPNPETLAVLENLPGNCVLRTDRSGAVSFVSDGDSLHRSLDAP